MKRNLLLLLSLLLALTLLTGCGAPDAGSGAAPQENPGEAPAETPGGSQPAADADYYSVCTAFSKTEVEQFAAQVQEQIGTADWNGLAQSIAYPISINGSVYADSAAFLAAPPETLFSGDFLAAVQNASCENMFCNDHGIMLGQGEIWLGEVLDSQLNSQGLRVLSLGLPEQTQQYSFQPGVWLAQGAGEPVYYFFYADSAAGQTRSLAQGMGVPFSYEAQGDQVIFYLGSPDSPAPATVTVTDDSHVTLQWQSGAVEELTYISEESVDTFHFYTDRELCDMALRYCQAQAQGGEDTSGLQAAAVINEDGSVSIQVYENVGDHNSTWAWFTVDRQSAAGTNDTTGAAVQLAN